MWEYCEGAGMRTTKPPMINSFRLSNDELTAAISDTLNALNLHHVKYNDEVLKATQKHYVALVSEQLKRATTEHQQ